MPNKSDVKYEYIFNRQSGVISVTLEFTLFHIFGPKIKMIFKCFQCMFLYNLLTINYVNGVLLNIIQFYLLLLN